MYFEFTRERKNITDNRIISEAQLHMTYNLTDLGEFRYLNKIHSSLLDTFFFFFFSWNES